MDKAIFDKAISLMNNDETYEEGRRIFWSNDPTKEEALEATKLTQPEDTEVIEFIEENFEELKEFRIKEYCS